MGFGVDSIPAIGLKVDRSLELRSDEIRRILQTPTISSIYRLAQIDKLTAGFWGSFHLRAFVIDCDFIIIVCIFLSKQPLEGLLDRDKKFSRGISTVVIWDGYLENIARKRSSQQTTHLHFLVDEGLLFLQAWTVPSETELLAVTLVAGRLGFSHYSRNAFDFLVHVSPFQDRPKYLGVLYLNVPSLVSESVVECLHRLK
jgi:hypothetical protein